MSSLLNNLKNSVMELRQVVNHHYADKDAADNRKASIFTVNYQFWNYVYQFAWSREIESYSELIEQIKSDAAINSVDWKRIYTIVLIVCVYSLFRTRVLKNYEKSKVNDMVQKNKEEVWVKLNKNKEKGVSEWDGDYSSEVTKETNDEPEDISNSSGFSFGKKSKANYKKNVKLLQKKYEEIQLQQQLQEDDEDDLADIAELLED
ncbi:hypothetical protein QEN19_004320 [Hanseniaspora menglaensis]